MGGIADEAPLYLSAVALDDERTEPAAFLGVVVGHEADATAAHMRIVGDNLLHDVRHLVGLAKVVFYLRAVVDGAERDFLRDGPDAGMADRQVTLVEILLLFLDEAVGQLVDVV